MFENDFVSRKSRHVQLIEKYNIKPVEPVCTEEYIKIPLDLPWDDLKNDVPKAFDKFGWYGMVHRARNDWTRMQLYGGLGLSYNPDYVFDLDPHAHGWGQPRSNATWSEDMSENAKKWDGVVQKYDYKKQEENIKRGLNTYDDPLGLRLRTPVTEFRSFRHIFEKFKRPLFQGRIAELRAREFGHMVTDEWKTMSWHTDEKNEIVSRLLIPLIYSEDYFIEFKETGNRIYFEPGYAYHWNTYKVHRWNFNYHSNIQNRTCVVIGWSPWLDFDGNQWSLNEYAGKVHPMDMILKGLLV